MEKYWVSSNHIDIVKNKKRWVPRKKKKRIKDPAIGLSVTVFNNNIEEALRRFKKKVEIAGVLDTVRSKQYYEKPSAIKRKKRQAAIALRKRNTKGK